jgi:hypothetical protein
MKTKWLSLAAAAALMAGPVLAQTTTTVQTSPQATPPPPPPSSTTEVVVNPSTPAPPPSTTVRTDRSDVYVEGVETETDHRSPVAIVAIDAMYGGLAGLLIGGGITLIDRGNNWERNLMVGAGAGLLAGAAVGAVHAVMNESDKREARRARTYRSAADVKSDGAYSALSGPQLGYGGKF